MNSAKPAISLSGVSKKYELYDNQLQRLAALLFPKRKSCRKREFWALKNINLSIEKGEVVGIVGKNGAGKSTLLQIICKTVTPTSGSTEVNGRIAALLELGSGFNPEFSGRENVFLSAAIAGMSRAEIEAKYSEIVSFAEIGEHIEQPVKTYSSGMMVRLAFAVATSIEPEILVIDEALSVGDGAFAKKSFDRIMELKNRGATILFCSHNLYQLKTLCNRALWIKDGNVEFDGDSNECVDRYQAFLDKPQEGQSSVSFGNEPVATNAKIVSVELYKNGEKCGHRAALESLVDELGVEICFCVGGQKEGFSVAWLITDDSLRNISSGSTGSDKFEPIIDDNGNGSVRLTISEIPLMRGEYLVHIFLMSADDMFYFDSCVNCCTVSIKDSTHTIGVVKLKAEWRLA